MTGQTGGRPSPPAVKTTVASSALRCTSLGRPSGPAMPAKASPTPIWLISMLDVPTPWTTRLIVPALTSQSASVSGINQMGVGDAFAGLAGPLGRPREVHRKADDATVVFTAGGLGLPPVYPIMREHLRIGNHVTLISGFRTADLMFWDGPDERVGRLQAEFGDRLDVIYATNDGTFGVPGFVTGPLEELLKANQGGQGRSIAEVVTIGPPMMMR